MLDSDPRKDAAPAGGFSEGNLLIINRHIGDRGIHSSGARIFGYSAAGLAGILGAKWLISNRWRALYPCKPEFKVYIRSPVNLEGLSEQQKELIAASNEDDEKLNGYIEVSFTTGFGRDEIFKEGRATADIYRHRTLVKADVSEQERGPLMKRETGEVEFTFDFKSNKFKGIKTVESNPFFLDNNGLLAKIVEANKMDEKKRREHFSQFSYGLAVDKRNYHGFEISTYCEIQARGDPVTYQIDGLHALIPEQDVNLFAEFFIRRGQVESYGTFKKRFDLFAALRGRIRGTIEAEDTCLASAYDGDKGDFGHFREFLQEYALFAAAAKRIEESRAEESARRNN